MAWFYYGDQRVRRYRKGIWLRIGCLPDELAGKIKSRLKEGELLAWVEVKELCPNNEVLLEVWCYQGVASRNTSKTREWVFDRETTERFTVFHVLAKEDPKWVCESDCGRGLVGAS